MQNSSQAKGSLPWMWPKTGSELPSLLTRTMIFTSSYWSHTCFDIRMCFFSPDFLTCMYAETIQTHAQTAGKHIHTLNFWFIFNPCLHSLACSLDLIWRCWANICMFLSNNWGALKRLWLSMRSAERIAGLLHLKSTHAHTLLLTGRDLIYAFCHFHHLFWFFVIRFLFCIIFFLSAQPYQDK